MMKIGGQVVVGRACGALAAEGSIDLAAGTTGKLLGVRGDHAKVELEGETPRVVYLATEYLAE